MRTGAHRLIASVLTGALAGPGWGAAPRVPASAWLAATPDSSGPRNIAAEQAQAQLEAGEFEQAVETLQKGLAAPDVADEQLAELYRLLGLAELYLGDQARARDAFEKLLQARPDFELPRSEPPKIRALYARIKDDIRVRRVRPVQFVATDLGEAAQDQALEVPVKVENLAAGAKAKLFFRRSGAQAYGSVDFVRQKGSADEFRATLPAFELPGESQPYDMDYYLEVADAASRRLAGRGDALSPLTFRVVPRPAGGEAAVAASPWYSNPWIWAGIGVVAAGAVAGAVVVATGQQTGSLPVTVKVEAAP